MSKVIWTPPGSGADKPAPPGAAGLGPKAHAPPAAAPSHAPPVEVEHHPTPAEMHQELEESRARVAELTTQLKYLTADMENFRRRKVKELDDARKNAQADVLTAFFQVMDGIEASLMFKDQDPVQVAQGVSMIHHQLHLVLDNLGVEVLCPAPGEAVDPMTHEGVATEPAAEGKTPGSITSVVAKGYRWGDRLLRPARVVVVAAAPEKEDPPPVAEDPVQPSTPEEPPAAGGQNQE